MNNITISIPKPEDAVEISDVLYKTWLSAYPNVELGITADDIEDHFKDEFTPEVQEKRMSGISNPKRGTFRLIAKDGERIIGTCRIETEGEFNRLRTIYVLPEYQGKGIGKMMWERLKKEFDPNKKIVVDVAEYNKKAISFYEKLGFVDSGKRMSDVRFKMKSGAMIPEMEMIKEGHD